MALPLIMFCAFIIKFYVYLRSREIKGKNDNKIVIGVRTFVITLGDFDVFAEGA